MDTKKQKDWIIGAGGGGDSNEPVRTPDSLLSQDYFELILALGEGPIKGLVSDNIPKTMEYFYAGDTPVYNVASSQAAFSDFAAVCYYGKDTDGSVKLELGGTSNNSPVNVTLSQGVAVNRSTPALQRNSFDRIEVRISFDSLYHANKDGTFEADALFTLQYKANSSGTWINFQGEAVTTVRGKTTAGYVRDFVFDVPKINEDYNIRLTKVSADGVPGVDETIVNMTWESIQVVNRGTLTFPNLAFFHIHGKASNQFSSIPEFSGVYEGLIVKVPTNYNEVTRTYDESTPWNGTFKDAYTNNNVWVLYDLITNPKHGLTRYYKSVTANRYDFYDEAKWCDEPVPDGRGGTQPRFTFNETISDPRPGLELLQYVAGSFNAILHDDGNGVLTLVSDRPRAATQVFTPENVAVEGFSYSFSDIPTRYNDITAVFVNPDLGWEEDRRSCTLNNTAEIAKNGRIPYEFIAVGCTDAYEAVRRANYRFIVANNEVATVSFETSRFGLMTELFSTILVCDPDADWGAGGRVKTVAGNTIHLRDPIYFPSLGTRTMKVQTFAGIVEIQVAPPTTGDVYSLTIVSGTFPVNVPPKTVFTIEDNSTLGYSKPFRVLSIEEVEGSPDRIRITALEIAEGKHEAAESGAVYIPSQYSYVSPGEPILPLSLTLTCPPPITSSDGTLLYRIEANWKRPVAANTKSFEIDFKRQDDAVWNTITAFSDRATLSPVKDGVLYTVRLYAISPLGVRSHRWLEQVIEVETKSNSLEPVLDLNVTQMPTGWEVSWTNYLDIPDFDVVDVRIGNAASNNYTALPTAYRTISSPLPLPWLATGTHRIMVKFFDRSGNESAVASQIDLVIQNPSLPVVGIERNLDHTKLVVQDCTTSQPIKQLEIRMGGVADSWSTAIDVGTAGANQRVVSVAAASETYTHVFVRAVDVAGNLSQVLKQAIPAATGVVDSLLTIVEEGLSESFLSPALLETIGLITAPSGTAGSVNARILSEANARADAIADEAEARALALVNPALNPAIDAAASAATTASNAATLAALKNRRFYSNTAPASDGSYTLQANDTWVDTDDTNKEYRYNGAAWVLSADTRISTALADIASEVTNRTNADLAEVRIRESLYSAVAGAGSYKVFNQATAPSGLVAADIGAVWAWKTDVTDIFQRWSGTAWVSSTSDRRSAIYRGAYTTLPTTGNVIGDVARNSTTNAVFVWDGASWISRTSNDPSYAFVDQEVSARSTAVAAEALRITSLGIALDDEVADRTAAISEVEQAIIDGDEVVATSVSTLATQMRGNYTGSDLALVTSGLIHQERTARTTAVGSLTQQIGLLSAGSSSQFDYSDIWYFDAGVEDWYTGTAGVTLSVNNGWLKLISNSGTVSGPWVESADNLGIDAAKYPQVRARVKKYGSPTWEGKVYFRTVADNTINETKSVAIAEPTFDGDGVALLTWNMPAAWTGTIRRIRLDIGSDVSTTSYYELDWIAVGRASPGASSAQLFDLSEAMVTADTAQVSRIEDLEAAVTDPTTGLSATATALDVVELAVNNATTGLVATANRATALESKVNSPSGVAGANYNPTYALLTTSYSTTAAMNAAIADQINTVVANLNTSGGFYTSIVQAQQKAEAKSANHYGPTAPADPAVDDTWIDTANGRILKVWNGTAWIAGDDTRIGTQATQITTLQSSVKTGEFQFQPNINYEFGSSVEGWIGRPTGTFTLTAVAGALRYTNTSDASGHVRRDFSAAEQFLGSANPIVRFRVRFTAGTLPTSMDFTYYWNASANSATQNVPLPSGVALNTWYIVEVDLSVAANYTGNTITRAVIAAKADALRTVEYDWIAFGKNGVGVSTAQVQEEITTRASETGHLGAQYALKVALVNGGSVAEVSGIAIAGTSVATGGSRFDMSFRANSFLFLPPSGQGNTPVNPLVYYATQTVVNGVTIPAGLYLKNAFIDYITAGQIDTRSLTIKDAAGNVILSAGAAAVNLDSTRINPSSGWLNTNVGGVNMVRGASNNQFSYGPGVYGGVIATLKTAVSNPHDLRGGEQITISADLWRDATAAAANQTASLYLTCRNAAGTATLNQRVAGSSLTAQRLSLTQTLPALQSDITTVEIRLFHQDGGATDGPSSLGTVNCDRLQAERGPTMTLYAPGVEPNATVGAPAGTYVGSQLAENVAQVAIDFNSSNNRNGAAVVAPTVASAATTVEHSINTDGSADVSFEWVWGGNQGDIDGFQVYFIQRAGTGSYTFGTTPADETVYEMPADKRAIVVYGVAANKYVTFGVRAYRRVDKDINASGIIVSTIAKPSFAGQDPYRPSANVAFGGDITGTVNSVAVATLTSNAANGAAAFTGTANLRSTNAPTNNGAFGTITSLQTADGNVVVTVPFTYTQGALPADSLLIYAKEGGGTVTGTEPCFLVNVLAGNIKLVLLPATTYTFGIRAARSGEGGTYATAIVTSTAHITPASAYSGNIGGVSAATIASAVTNFNTGNDRNAAAVVAPTTLTDGTALDHTLNVDGSVDISFEWAWAGNEGDIDGFQVFVIRRTGAGAYTFGSTPAEEQVYEMPASKRACIVYGAAADFYYTFGVRAYRKVDKDVNAAGVLVSAIVKATGTGENPYQPSTSVVFNGNVAGSVNNVAVATLTGNAADGATAFTGTAQYRNPGAPTNNPAPTGITVTNKSNGSCDIRLDWSGYTQGARRADLLLIFWRKSPTSSAVAPTLSDASIALSVNSAASYYVFSGVNPADFYSFGIAAARKTENGLEVGAIVAPTSAPDWIDITGGTPNFTANVNGVAASSVTADASAGATAAAGTANYRNDAEPSTNPTFGAITQSATADGNIVVTVPYTYAQGALPADQLFVYFRKAGGPVQPSDPAMATNAVSGEIKFTLEPLTTYSFGLQAVRRTESGLKAKAIVTSADVVTVGSNYTGSLNGTAASTVVTNASTALSNANSANSAIADMSSDSILSPVEKPEVVAKYNAIIAEQAGIGAQATAYSITAEKTTYDAAISALTTYLNGLTSWNVIPGVNVAIVGSTFRQKFNDVYSARQTLLNSISSRALARLDNDAIGAALNNDPYFRMASEWIDGAHNSQATIITVANGVAGDRALSGAVPGQASDTRVSFPVTVGRRYRISAKARKTAGANGAMFLRYVRRNALNQNIGQVTIPALESITTLPAAPDWGTYSADFVAGASDVYVALRAILNWQGSVGTHELQDFRIEDVTEAYANSQAASAAALAASNAQLTADNVNGLVANIVNDAKFTPNEKALLRAEWDGIAAAHTGLMAQSNTLGVTTERTTYSNAFTALANYLNAGVAWTTGVPTWISDANLSVTTDVVAATFRSNWSTFYSARQGVLNAMSARASERAVWSNVTGTETITANANSGAAAFTGTTNLRSNSSPSNLPALPTATYSTTADGNVLVTLAWTAYTQGLVPADALLVYFLEGGRGLGIPMPETAPSYTVGLTATSIRFPVKPNTVYSFGIQAIRSAESGVYRTTIPATTNSTSPAGDYTGNIAGTAAATVQGNAAAVVNKLNKNAADIMTGPIALQAQGGIGVGVTWAADGTVSSGTGVAITAKGIAARRASGPTFTVDAETGEVEALGLSVKNSSGGVLLSAVGNSVPPWVVALASGGAGVSLVEAANSETNRASIRSLKAGQGIGMSVNAGEITISSSSNNKTIGLASDWSVSSTSPAFSQVPGLFFPLEASSTYIVRVVLKVRTAAATTGVYVGAEAPYSATTGGAEVVLQATARTGVGTAETKSTMVYQGGGMGLYFGNSFADFHTGIGTFNASAASLIEMTAIVRTGSVLGNFQVIVGTEVNGSAVTVSAGSFLQIEKINDFTVPVSTALAAAPGGIAASYLASRYTIGSIAIATATLTILPTGGWSLTRTGGTTLTGSWLSSGSASSWEVMFDVTGSVGAEASRSNGAPTYTQITQNLSYSVQVTSYAGSGQTITGSSTIAIRFRNRATGAITTFQTTVLSAEAESDYSGGFQP